MKYETPELIALTPAINAIQSLKPVNQVDDGGITNESSTAYADWED
jgi:hypothetical protein